ncbi:TonB-dependent receptor domain-containing protein [Muribaculum intestinale]|nr:TonB-dependent receptor [Muribaculum intestinale]
MNNLIIKSILFFLMTVMSSAAFAHTNATSQSRVDIAISPNLKGVVVDENKTPIDFVNVVLLKVDSTYLAGTVTDKDGTFAFKGDYDSPRFIKVSSVGYASQTLDIPLTGNFGMIVLATESTMLGEVVVKSNRPVTAIKGDALVTNVAGTQLEHAGTAEDVLVQVPMVVGRDGSFEVFGKGSPAIYINGRLVRDSNELMQISSADIKNVEVVTNPGVRYDASVNSVIRITTKRPQGDGFSGLLRSVLRENKYVSSVNQANFKYRTGGLEVFANFGGAIAKFQSNQYGISNSSMSWKEEITQNGYGNVKDFFGKAGFSYMFNEKHSIGAYYSNGITNDRMQHSHVTDLSADDEILDVATSLRSGDTKKLPRHYANMYYNGKIGDLGIDLNADYLWNKSRSNVTVDGISLTDGKSLIHSLGANRGRMFAEKLVLSYPVWNGTIEAGEEFVSSRFSSDYVTDAEIVDDANTRVDENNIAGFIDFRQTFGRFNFGAGLRYEHVNFDYLENGQKKENQSKTYNNLFPSFFMSTTIDKVQLSLNYTGKTKRPNYGDLDGTIDYINRYTLQGGNPYLKPEKIHSVELTGAWRRFFAQLSYTYKKDPIISTTVPYGESGEVKLMTLDNFPEIHSIRAFIGASCNIGIWEPRINLGLTKQWFAIDTWQGRKHLNNPQGMVQWQNAIHLSYDVWLNVDMAWESAGNDRNLYRKACSYVNAKLYKAFFNNSFSVSVEANDIFNQRNYGVMSFSRDITRYVCVTDLSRSFYLTLQYTFNSSRDRYKGRGAGTNEKNRF